MTDPVRVGELLPGVLAEVVDRAGHGYERWAEQVAAIIRATSVQCADPAALLAEEAPGLRVVPPMPAPEGAA